MSEITDLKMEHLMGQLQAATNTIQAHFPPTSRERQAALGLMHQVWAVCYLGYNTMPVGEIEKPIGYRHPSEGQPQPSNIGQPAGVSPPLETQAHPAVGEPAIAPAVPFSKGMIKGSRGKPRSANKRGAKPGKNKSGLKLLAIVSDKKKKKAGKR